ncbi:hypothetical protein COV53_02335 [Candidatus Gottesmanbacteria bacterium CG11_big_fil_rev_8_21_14_0_20_37_11]|uniref:NGG1p interacting factor NIF3 n=2 Tax=Candidatus Gottesmaniibacteriota TaxID=1752720 RepID=A0A2M7RSH8_9BACT|nr:MAG: hypothetical protein COX23_03515 [Candidatus Gottesmanbacteria bacterium CG23_combo_of_CG06-09_8_20_14_all_37_19]PIR08572.1 MAG: hypothetical protein COV53_02335 [Candidatus Gottesmanbacteria bacterium CG11_big_fil_rev_8_21_14_0_20_37_11]PIZ03252.1 MAG: hypothetical protein COY59_00510 [Candidatus Gottesmanbacteria bacterium CG_4_10_14_0_8_um_filter_37_24]
MKLKFFVYCSDEEKIIKDIIIAASAHGAGIYGNYSQVAFITHGEGNWKSEKGAQPFQGIVGEVTKAPVARIEMTCLSKNAKQIERAIKQIHPWEQVDIEFFRIEEI